MPVLKAQVKLSHIPVLKAQVKLFSYLFQSIENPRNCPENH